MGLDTHLMNINCIRILDVCMPVAKERYERNNVHIKPCFRLTFTLEDKFLVDYIWTLYDAFLLHSECNKFTQIPN